MDIINTESVLPIKQTPVEEVSENFLREESFGLEEIKTGLDQRSLSNLVFADLPEDPIVKGIDLAGIVEE
jgi:hypothetical protein